MDAVFKARTNFVKIENVQGLVESLKPFDVDLIPHTSEVDVFMLKASTGDGDFPSLEVSNEDGEEVIFTFESVVMPFVEEGQVLVAMSAGSTGTRAIHGYAGAYLRLGKEVKSTAICLDDIYDKAANEFGVSEKAINRCHGEDFRRKQPKRA